MINLAVRYALKNIKFNKLKSIGTALICLVCASFFVLETMSMQSFKINNTRALDETFGIHNGIFACNSETLLDIKEDNDFSETGTLSVLFHAIRDENSTERKIIIGTADADAYELQKIHLIMGDFPKNSKEIALEETLVNVLFPRIRIGDKILLKITDPISSEAEFTLCGVLANFSNLQWNPREKGTPMVNALTMCDESRDALYNFVSVLGEVRDPHKYGGLYYPNQRDNYDTLKAVSGISADTTSTMIILVFAVFTVIIMIVAAYALSRGNEKTIGLMKTAGFSGGTILLFLIAKSTVLLVPSAILGTVIGLILFLLMNKTIISEAFMLSIICCIIVIAAFLIANCFFAQKECKRTVIENLRQNSKINFSNNTAFTTDNPIALYSVKNFILNGKEVATSCIMVFLSALLLFITASVIAQMEKEYEKMKRPYDLVLGFQDQTITSVNVSRYIDDGISDSEFNALSEYKTTSYALGCKRLYVYELNEAIPYSPLHTGNSEEDFIRDKESLGFPNCGIIANRLYGLDSNSLLLLKKYTVEGQIDVEALSNGKNVIWRRRNDENSQVHSVGDKLKLSYVINHNPENASSFDDLEYFETEVEISAIIDIPQDSADETDLMFKNCIQGGWIWSEKAFEQINVEKRYDLVFLKAADKKESFGSLFTIIDDMKIYYGDRFIMTDYLQEQQSFEEFQDAFKSISFIVAGGLVLFSIAGLAIMTVTKCAGRKRVFGFLRAVGLTKQQMFEIILIENGLSVAVAFALGVLCGFVVVMIMGLAVSGLLLLSLLILLYFIAIFLIGHSVSSRSFKETIVNCIRCE